MLNSLNAGDFTDLKVHRTKSMVHSVEICKQHLRASSVDNRS